MFESAVCTMAFFNWINNVQCGKCFEVVPAELQLHRRCVTDSAHTLNLTSFPPHICTLECMRRQHCLFTNYNKAQKYCLLIDDKCMQWEVDNEFELRYLGLPRQKCVSWVPVSVFNPTLGVTRSHGTYAGRWRDAFNTVPGKYIPSQGVVYVAMGGAAHHFPNGIEVLQVHPECQVTWLDYTAGEPIPDGAVAGGSLATEVGTDIYVIRAQVSMDDQFGYYDPNTNLGYGEGSNAVHTYTRMDIMALA